MGAGICRMKSKGAKKPRTPDSPASPLSSSPATSPETSCWTEVNDRLKSIESKLTSLGEDVQQLHHSLENKALQHSNMTISSQLSSPTSQPTALTTENKIMTETILDKQAHGMEENVTFTGIPEPPADDHKRAVRDIRTNVAGSRRETPQSTVPGLESVLVQESVPVQETKPVKEYIPADQRLLLIRLEFINRVSEPNVKGLMDELLGQKVINYIEKKSLDEKTGPDKARDLIDMVQKKGSNASLILINAFCELEPFLSEELKLFKDSEEPFRD